MPQPPSFPTIAAQPRVRPAGKYLRCGGAKWQMEGVSYGPFRPNARGEPFPEDDVLTADFARIRAMGFNTLRVYDLPSEGVLTEAGNHGLRLIVGIPWTDHVDFLRQRHRRQEIERRVREAALRLGNRDEVVALLIGNEIEKTLVRWMGPVKVKRFLQRLITLARACAPDCLLSYATYPSTEYLIPANADFVAVNVYLEQREAFEKYLRRLQNLAGNRPLVITEFGVDVLHHGEARQAEIRQWQRECLERQGVAGNVWFSYTDEWFRGGEEVVRWAFGLVTRDRVPRLAAVLATSEPQAFEPRISVVVCTCNGSETLRECLEALGRQSYANHEVIVIDDGSTDSVPEIARAFPAIRYQRQEHAGLSVARNLGTEIASGDIIAFTDDDCMADEDWLTHLSRAFDDAAWVAAGGPNIPPQARTSTEALVAVAPGGPSHVLLNDEEAEHLPGCNLAIRKAALVAIGGFRAPFMTAGDDVDVCWRLREAGGKLRFVAGAMVWHHRRFTVRAYLRQQRGYGRAEALLMKHHPERFGSLGGARWRGLIYGDGRDSLPPTEGSIFHGPFGTGLFQVIYTSSNAYGWFDLLAGMPWIAVLLVLTGLRLPIAALGVLALASYFAWRRMAGHRAVTIRDKVLLWWLCLMQPVVREWARIQGMIQLGARPAFKPFLPQILPPRRPSKSSHKVLELAFWSASGVGREDWMRELRHLLAEERLTAREDDGWRWFDFELFGTVGLASVTEYHGGLNQLTRVSLSRRSFSSQWQVMIFAVVLYVLVDTYVSRWLSGHAAGTVIEVIKGCLLVGGLMGARWLILWPVAKFKARDLVLRAAQRAGLRPLDGQEDGPMAP